MAQATSHKHMPFSCGPAATAKGNAVRERVHRRVHGSFCGAV